MSREKPSQHTKVILSICARACEKDTWPLSLFGGKGFSVKIWFVHDKTFGFLKGWVDIESLRITVEVDVVLVRSNNMIKRTRRIYSSLTWHVTSLS